MASQFLKTICFYIFGVVCLSAWNFFITPQSYWNAKFSQSNNSNSTDLNPYQQFWDSSLSVAICGVQFTFCCVGTFSVNYFSRKFRFIFCFLSLIGLFLICAVLAYVDTSSFTEVFFSISLTIAVAMTILSSTLNITCSLEAAEYDQVAVFLSGQSVAGIIAAIANLLTITLSDDVYLEALSFFISAGVIILMGFISYICLYGICDDKQEKISEYDQLDENNNHINQTTENQPLLSPISPIREVQLEESYWTIFNTLRVESLCLVTTFMVTIAVFPTLLSTYKPTDNIISEKYFLPIFCFLNFNIFDLVGREIAGRIKIIQNRLTLSISTFIRITFLIMLTMTNCLPRHSPVYLHGDWVYIILVTMLGLTNGLNASLAFISGCSSVSQATAPRAAAFLTICLTFGLTLGACSSFLVIYAI